jgi:ATP-dependent Lon protease
VTEERLLTLPVLVLKDFALFPHCIARFHVEQMSPAQRHMLENASASNTSIFIIKSRSGVIETPTQADLHRIGIVARAGPKQTAGKWTAIQVSGASRGELVDLQHAQERLTAQVRQLPHVPAKDEAALEAFKTAMAPWDEYETLCYDAGIHSGGIQMSPPDVDIEDAATLCDVLANGAQFRIENEHDVKFLDLQPLLDELDPLARFKLFGEFFQAELDRLKSDPELSRKVEIERERRKREEDQRARERAAKIDRLRAIATQGVPTAASASLLTETLDLPMLPLRDTVMFPFQQSTFIVGRKRSIEAVEVAIADNLIFLAAQLNEEIDDPTLSDLFGIGTVAHIIQNFRLPDGNIKLVVQGLRKAKLLKLTGAEGYLRAKLEAETAREYPVELQETLALAGELLKSSGRPIEDKQQLLGSWDGNDPHGWIAKAIPLLEEESG